MARRRSPGTNDQSRRLRIGAHTSIAGGLFKALERGAESGCDVVQVFTSSSQQWRTRRLTNDDIEQWRQARAATGVEPAMAHSSYLINLASPTRGLANKSYGALSREYARCARLEIPYLVMHPGAHKESGVERGIERIAQSLDRLADDQPDNPTVILLENTAGQGTSIGHRFEHMRDIFARVAAPQRLGLCLDTCHTLAAGYDIVTPSGWARTMVEIDRVVGCEWIRAFHVNDSKKPLGSHVDRHEQIGRGAIGLGAFHCLVNDRRFVGLPMVIETPKLTEYADSINLAALRALAGRKRITERARRLAAQPLHRRPVR